ncbi:hypothetical protein [Flavilitoribacter nigricans]|uniref:Uncharacterized protein n=1 Tax=Flavilitoribacter nigricans (strain ATCC 23147 / DSM 23189 / NBRC 102662 / NCIMB 1420 / SS-2) TaxID=1122177 RepID=A0A2D0NEA2_FLAN2|nr:hypothetical protein [Flavilitoribacter nigricans]PHN06509.1 hypothetical protein CRP01_09380 [Flavilitoribacter nigricans DSM 23189 = NBRC 102662]
MYDKHLNFQRMGHLLVSDLKNTWLRNLLLISGLLVLGVLVFTVLVEDSSMTRQDVTYLADQWRSSAKFHISFFPAYLMVGGLIFTSLVFWELRGSASRQFFLALPATNLEKWMSKWVLSALLFPLILTVVYQLFAQYTYQRFLGMGFEMVHLPLSDPWIWQWFFMYVLVQSIFFLGAVWVPRFSLIRTALMVAGVLGLCILIYQFGLYTLMPALSEEVRDLAATATTSGFQLCIEPEFQSYLSSQYPFRFKMIFGLFLFPMAMLISYLKLKEKQL